MGGLISSDTVAKGHIATMSFTPGSNLQTSEFQLDNAEKYDESLGAMRSKIILIFVSVFVIVCTVGCVSDEAHRYYAERRYPARKPEDVDVLFSVPELEHKIIADFQARGADVEYMRKRAAEIGADAVIVGTYGGQRAKSDDWAGQDKRSHTYSRITGTAIRYKE